MSRDVEFVQCDPLFALLEDGLLVAHAGLQPAAMHVKSRWDWEQRHDQPIEARVSLQ